MGPTGVLTKERSVELWPIPSDHVVNIYFHLKTVYFDSTGLISSSVPPRMQ